MVVADMGTSLAFYRRLGLDLPAEADEQPHVEVTVAGGLRLAFDSEEVIRSFAPDWQPAHGAGRIGLAFRVDGPPDVDAAYAELVDAGYHGECAPWDAFWGQRYAVVHDPDGNSVDLFAPLAANS
ncbi:MAG: glyoxalase [Pseudonocardiaceae bacterium]|nr:glyoxalase [Pseudonocardiaceae bacterium]